eukprot:TRINITY_DN9516_c0_g1_i1.p2 TRINITY_DN9516_c0_g1~~TRINITY_DN9516_c0_g1_i1.p2  ORF type:complete len:238 (+),score=45.14 TRINITY_DN9516_c0_g1_i1:1167-1880(+)
METMFIKSDDLIAIGKHLPTDFEEIKRRALFRKSVFCTRLANVDQSPKKRTSLLLRGASIFMIPKGNKKGNLPQIKIQTPQPPAIPDECIEKEAATKKPILFLQTPVKENKETLQVELKSSRKSSAYLDSEKKESPSQLELSFSLHTLFNTDEQEGKEYQDLDEEEDVLDQSLDVDTNYLPMTVTKFSEMDILLPKIEAQSLSIEREFQKVQAKVSAFLDTISESYAEIQLQLVSKL